MIKLQDSLNNSLKLLKNFLTNVRYDWVYQRLTDLGYFYDPTTFPTDKTVTNQLFHLAIQSNTFALFRNGQKLFKDAAAELLNLPLQQDLADLGLLKLSQDGVQTNGYHIGVWLGFYFIQSSAEITASVKVEDYRIAQEIMKFSGNSLLCLGSDVAFTAITNSANWKNIDTVAKNSEAFQIATANTILNDLESKVRVIEYEEIDQSRNYDLIATTETSLLLPVEYQHYYPGPSVSENFEAIEKILKIFINTKSKQLCLLAKVYDREKNAAILDKIASTLQNRKTKVFILSKNFVSKSFIHALSEIIRLKKLSLKSKEIVEEIEKHYQNIQSVYDLLIHSEQADETSFEVINFASSITTRDTVNIPKDLELLPSTNYYIQSGQVLVELDKYEKTAVEQMVEETKLLQELVTKVANEHSISESASAALILKLIHKLFLNGLIDRPEISNLTGQLRLIQLNATRFAQTLQTLAKDLDSEEV